MYKNIHNKYVGGCAMDFNNENGENSGYDNNELSNYNSENNNNNLNNGFNNDDNNSYNNDNSFNNGNFNNGSYNNGNYNNDNYNQNYNNNGFNKSYNNGYNNNYNGANGYAIASLVLGILSIPLGCCYGLGLILAIISIVFAFVSRKQSSGKFTGMAIAGIICSVLGIICSIFMIFCVVAYFSMFDISSMNDLINSLETPSYYDFY